MLVRFLGEIKSAYESVFTFTLTPMTCVCVRNILNTYNLLFIQIIAMGLKFHFRVIKDIDIFTT